MIEAENSHWAKALRDKMLTLERIFTWRDDLIVDVIKRLPVKNQAFAMNGLKDEWKAKIQKFFTVADMRRLNDVMTESKPKPEEIQAALLKMVEMARQMLKDRELHAEKFDEGLLIPEDYESKLEGEGANAAAMAMVSSAPEVAADAPPAPGGAPTADVYQLQRSLGLVLNENKKLKEELRTLRDKLEQIRKIA